MDQAVAEGVTRHLTAKLDPFNHLYSELHFAEESIFMIRSVHRGRSKRATTAYVRR
jgi:hypothetical protein